MDKIGQRIKTFRKRKGYNLTKFAEEMGLSLSYMSQIESGKSNISVALLLDIAKKLELPSVSVLLDSTPREDIQVIRTEERKSYLRNEKNATIEMLFATEDRQLEASIIHLPVGNDTQKPAIHQGEEFCYVISGHVSLCLEGRGIYELKKGDVVSYPASIPHWYKNIGDVPCEVLMACTPVSF